MRGRRGLLSMALPLVLVAAASACRPGAEVALYPVERRDFQHRVTAEGTLVAQSSVVIHVPSQARRGARIVWLLADGTEVARGDVVVRFDAEEMQRMLDESAADYETGSLRIEKAGVDSQTKMAEIEKNRSVAELELSVAERFQKTDDEVYSRADIIESAIDGELASDRRDHAAEMLGVQSDLTETELDLLRIERRKAQIRLDEAREGLEALEVRSPQDGVLSYVRDWRGEMPQIGQQVWPSQPLAEIPALKEMKAEVFVLEADAGGVEIGRKAVVRVEAHPEMEVAATVVRVDAVAKPRFRGQPVQYFGVELELESTDPATMKPGQRVLATLLLADHPDAVVVPRQALWTDDEGSYVWIRRGGGFERRRVEITAQSVALAVIASGLEGGELVALEPPTQAPASEPASNDGKLPLAGG